MSAKDAFNAEAAKRALEINKTNRHGTNKLIRAIEAQKTERVNALIDAGADLGFRTEKRTGLSHLTHDVPYGIGSTPLHAACLHGALAIVALLLEKGAEASAKNASGHTPLDYALLSYSYYKTEHAKKTQTKFALQRSRDRFFEKAQEYALVIKQMVKAGAKTGLFVLPEEFAEAKTSCPAHKP